MRRIIVALLAAGALALALGGLASAAEGPRTPGARAAAQLPAWAAVQTCHRSARLGRYATFYARMRWIRRTRRMSMRFTLYESLGDGSFLPVAVPGLNRWRVSRARVVRFGYRQTVKGLRDGARYRVTVRFRWHRPGGRVIRSATRRSGVCSYVRG